MAARGGSRYGTPEASAPKRDSLAAQLDQDPSLSTARRAVKADLFSSRMATKSLERRLITAENAKEELERALKEKEIAIERLAKERRWLSERETEEREEKERLIHEWAEEKKGLDRQVRELRDKVHGLQKENANIEDEHSELRRSTNSSINAQKLALGTLERKVQLLEEDLARTRDLAQQHKDAAHNLKDQLERLETEREEPTRRGDDETWRVLRDELHSQTAHWKRLEAENAQLTRENHNYKTKHTSLEVLREENRDLKRQLSAALVNEEAFIRLQGEVEAARKEREEWAAFLSNPNAEPTSKTPSAVTSTISSLRLQNAELMEQNGSLSSVLARRESEVKTLEYEAEESAKRISSLSQQLSSEQQRNVRLQRRFELSEKETRGLKALLATYEAEEQRSMVIAKDEEGTEPPARFDAAKTQRIQVLEAEVDELKYVNKALEEEIDAMKTKPLQDVPSDVLEEYGRATARVVELEEELQEANQIVETSQDKVMELEQQLFELGATVNAGNLVPPGTRVVQFAANPVREDIELKKEAFERLRQENSTLVQRLGEVEHGMGILDEQRLVPRVSFDNLLLEKSEMEKTVADKEKRLLRLKQVFTAKTEEFRQTVSNILGYTLFFQPTKIRLTSTYNLAAAITFQLNTSSRTGPGGEATMKLLGAGSGEDAGLTPKLNELIQYWIVEKESVPCFMAALTLECFQRSHGDDPRAPDDSLTSDSAMQLTRTVA